MSANRTPALLWARLAALLKRTGHNGPASQNFIEIAVEGPVKTFAEGSSKGGVWIQIARPGGGFTPDDLAAVAANYDASVPVPVLIAHGGGDQGGGQVQALRWDGKAGVLSAQISSSTPEHETALAVGKFARRAATLGRRPDGTAELRSVTLELPDENAATQILQFADAGVRQQQPAAVKFNEAPGITMDADSARFAAACQERAARTKITFAEAGRQLREEETLSRVIASGSANGVSVDPASAARATTAMRLARHYKVEFGEALSKLTSGEWTELMLDGGD